MWGRRLSLMFAGTGRGQIKCKWERRDASSLVCVGGASTLDCVTSLVSGARSQTNILYKISSHPHQENILVPNFYRLKLQRLKKRVQEKFKSFFYRNWLTLMLIVYNVFYCQRIYSSVFSLWYSALDVLVAQQVRASTPGMCWEDRHRLRVPILLFSAVYLSLY